MKNYQYLTNENFILRQFAKDRLIIGDLDKWEIIRYSTSIPRDYELVIYLNLYNQKLKRISLETLYCIRFDCFENKLIKLPKLPYCEKLICYNNRIKELPELPYCKELHCADNLLTSLPDLPNCTYLNCYNNQIKELPELPKCVYLDNRYNLIKR